MRGLGLTVVRLTWSDVVERPAATAQRIRGHECRLDGRSAIEMTFVGEGPLTGVVSECLHTEVS